MLIGFKKAGLERTPMLYFVGFCLFVFLFFTQFTLRTPTYGERSIDVQVVAKLFFHLSIFIIFLPGILKSIFFTHNGRTYYFSLICYFLLLSTLIGAYSGFYSYYSFFYVFFTFHFTIVAYKFLGRDGMLIVFFNVCTVLFFLSVIFYYANPSVARYAYWTLDGFYFSSRMQGVVGHPNTLAFLCVTAIFLLYYFFSKELLTKRITFIYLVFFLCILFLTNSKTNIFSLLFCFSLIFFIRGKTYEISLLIFIFAFVVLVSSLVFGWVDIFLKGISRTGNIEEILTFTGRTYIWRFILDLVFQQPVLGWGYANTAALLVDNSENIGFTVAQAHSTYFQLLISGGFVCFFLYLVLVFRMFFLFVSKRDYISLMLLVHFVVVGVSESMVFNTVPNLPFVFFILLLVVTGYNDSNV
ncbi:O-antigen ligase family protein [Shewanella inventionis]|uniref:O-antigen ligase family protein n=1 Tax=Shewanella inventionis TaxID=1738770 RepID=UPI001CBC2866|nr:O-antigen ligase family protein [Shewanella inventionis]UAL45125.1 O-antigen ligase family protein [Shewanella inventionis]